jgi:hypothetical protein
MGECVRSGGSSPGAPWWACAWACPCEEEVEAEAVERRDEEDVGTGTAGAGAGVRRFLMMRPALGVDDGWAAVEVEVEVAAREERMLLSCGGSRSR